MLERPVFWAAKQTLCSYNLLASKWKLCGRIDKCQPLHHPWRTSRCPSPVVVLGLDPSPGNSHWGSNPVIERKTSLSSRWNETDTGTKLDRHHWLWNQMPLGWSNFKRLPSGISPDLRRVLACWCTSRIMHMPCPEPNKRMDFPSQEDA